MGVIVECDSRVFERIDQTCYSQCCYVNCKDIDMICAYKVCQVVSIRNEICPWSQRTARVE